MCVDNVTRSSIDTLVRSKKLKESFLVNYLFLNYAFLQIILFYFLEKRFTIFIQYLKLDKKERRHHTSSLLRKKYNTYF